MTQVTSQNEWINPKRGVVVRKTPTILSAKCICKPKSMLLSVDLKAIPILGD